ncbi:MAG: glycosyl hydrolase family 32, partial [Chloroflexota bacterium]|nr:glycosyl hydrolase family 32 [Chloroflexota bacterium]
MFTLPGYTIGDAWLAVSDGVAHCFFCTSPPPDADWHWDIGHAVSRDLVHWEYVGFALERGAGEAWDSQTLSTGSVLAWNGRFWMAYSALRRNENPPTRKVHRVGLAISDDLYAWTKYEHNPVNERDPRLYERLGPVH